MTIAGTARTAMEVGVHFLVHKCVLKAVLALAVFTVVANFAKAEPAEILIIRHGEKARDSHLSPRGYERAKALVALFTANERFQQFGTPVAIFAAHPNHADGSVRSIETVTPLANKLNLYINEDYARDDIQPLIEKIVLTHDFDGKMVLISWPHDAIPAIAAALGARAPRKWPSSVFDRVWKIDLTSSGAAQFVDLPQNVLPGDSTN